MRLVILVLVGLALGLPAAAAEGESGPYPIWWSPSLELDSLDRIDARLQRPLWPDRPDSGFTVTVIEDSGEREDFAGSCAGILRIERGPPFDLVHVELRTWFHQSARCRALVRLKEAAPARRSFVRDFVLSEAAIDVLPAVIDPDSSCGGGGGACELYWASKARMSWREYQDEQRERFERGEFWFLPEDVEFGEYFLRIEVLSDHQMDVEISHSWTHIHILARADLTGDGLEDLLLMMDNKAKGGTWSYSKLHLFTREIAGEVFRVIAPESYLCPDYQCD